MSSRHFLFLPVCAASIVTLAWAQGDLQTRGQRPARIDLLESDIATIHGEMLARRLTAVDLVGASLARIASHDRRGAGLHAVVNLVPGAMAEAAAADTHLTQEGVMIGPLHGIPVVVKDNIDVAEVPTTLGMSALADAVPPGDATVVTRLRRAGAIVIAKTNLASLARSSRDTVSEVLGRTLNPYSADHTTAGSSGGTAAAVAAGFAIAGLGTDTGASIRAPSAHCCLVGIRPAHGSLPMEGIAPLYVARDTVGPMARHVRDAALLLSVLAQDDELLEAARAAPARLDGCRIGVLRGLADPRHSDPEVLDSFERALTALRGLGAVIVDVEEIVDERDREHIPVERERFPADLDAFLRTRRVPPEATASYLLGRTQRARSRAPTTPVGTPLPASPVGSAPVALPGTNQEATAVRAEALARTAALRAALESLFERHHVLVHPTWSKKPLALDAPRAPNGDNSGFVAPPAGHPSITVPMGFVTGLPVGIEFVAPPGRERTLVATALAFEHHTSHRRPPRLP